MDHHNEVNAGESCLPKLYLFQVPHLFQYTDYRAFLREWFEEAKKERESLSYRFIAGRIGIDPGFLVRIFQGTKHLSETHLPALCKVIRLNKRETQYFERLVLFCKAKGDREIQERFLSLMELRESKVREISAKQYRYYQHWYIPAIRCLIAAKEFRGNFAELASILNPAITSQEAHDAVRVLEDLQMVQKNRHGVWETLDSHISAGDAWTDRAVREFQKQAFFLGIRGLETLPKEHREFSTLTFSIPREEFSSVQDLIRDFRTKMARWTLAQENADAVYHMNIQVFPMALPALEPKE